MPARALRFDGGFDGGNERRLPPVFRALGCDSVASHMYFRLPIIFEPGPHHSHRHDNQPYWHTGIQLRREPRTRQTVIVEKAKKMPGSLPQ